MEKNQEIDELANDSVKDEILENGVKEDKITLNKKNKSNFNSLYKKTKELESSLSEKEKLIAEKDKELEEWRNFNPEIVDEKKSKNNSKIMELKIFWLENPEAKPHLEVIKETMEEYGVDYNKAWKLVKVDLPEESITKKDFDFSKSNIKMKDLSKISPSDALKLSPEKQREWRKINLK